MKRIGLFLGVALLGIAVAIVGVAVFVVDAEAVRGLVVRQATQALDREVEVGELDLVFFPSPAVRVQTLRVAGDAGQPPLLQVEEVRLRIALWPLLKGRVVLAAVELGRPSVWLPVDADGVPVVPELGAKRDAGGRSPAPSPSPRPAEAAPSEEATASPVRLAIDELIVDGGQLEAGPWKISELRVSGALALDGVSELEASARVEGLGEVRDGRIRLQGLESPAPQIDVEARLEAFGLADLADRLALVPDPLKKLSGTLSGPVRAALRGGELASAQAELAIAALDLETADVAVAGDVPLRVELGRAFALDLTQTEVRSDPTLRKPRGGRLEVTGELGPELGPEALRRVVLALGPNQVPVVPDLAKSRLRVEPFRLELEPLSPWLDLRGRAAAGAIRLEKPMTVSFEPLGITGTLSLDAVRVPVEQGVASLQGPIVARGQTIRFDGLELALGEQTTRLTGGYDLAAGRMELDVGIEEADVAAMLTALQGSSKLRGTLGAQLRLEGAPALESLQGFGRFAISPGEIQDFSLLRQVLGDLAKVAEEALRSKGKDLSRYEQERFERLEGDFALEGGRLQIRSLLLTYRYGRAELRGIVGLLGDQPLDLAGSLTLNAEVASDILRKPTDQVLTLPDVAIGGTLADPRVRTDAASFARMFARLATQEAVGQKLDKALKEKLGASDSDVEAVKGVLDNLLGGKKKK